MDAAAQARFDLISDNLAEFLNPEIIENILIRGDNPKIYWGTGESPFFYLRPPTFLDTFEIIAIIFIFSLHFSCD